MMNNTMKRAMIACLVAATAISAFGCSKDKNENIPVETISLEQTKQELTFDFKTGVVDDIPDATEGTEETTEAREDATEGAATTAAAATGAVEQVTEFVKVTDAAGQDVTDASGEAVTEATVVATRPLETAAADTSEIQEGASAEATTEAAPDAAPAVTDAPVPDYTPAYDTCKAYWLDMSKQGDFTFNGEFLTVTFQIKSDIPNGSYPVRLSKTDIASWEEVRYYPEIINGEVAVGQSAAQQETMSDKDFSLKVNSVEAKQGQTVTMTIDLANNPGFCGFVIDIQYDSNAMEIVKAGGGKDYDQAVSLT